MIKISGKKYSEDLKTITLDTVRNIYSKRGINSDEAIKFFNKSIDRAISDIFKDNSDERNFEVENENDYRNRLVYSAKKFINVINREYLVSKHVRRNLPNPEDNITAESFVIPKY